MSETNTQTEQTAAAGHGVPEITRRARLVVPVSLGLVLVVMAVLVIVLGVVPRMQARASLVQRTGDRLAEKPRVSTVVAAAAGWKASHYCWRTADAQRFGCWTGALCCRWSERRLD